MNQNHYLNYAVYMNQHGDYLVKVTGGYFASEAFRQSDEAYAEVLGDKFGGIFGDDGKHATCDKRSIRRLASDEEFNKLFESACPAFKFVMKCLDIFKERRAKITDEQGLINLSWARSKFEMETCVLPQMLEKYPDVTPEEYVNMYIK